MFTTGATWVEQPLHMKVLPHEKRYADVFSRSGHSITVDGRFIRE